MSGKFNTGVISRYFFSVIFVLLTGLCIHAGYVASFCVTYPADWKILETGYWKTHSSYRISGPDGSAPVQLPGPLDSWAGGETKTITFSPAYAGTVKYTVHLLDSHDSAAPVIAVWVNGKRVTLIHVTAGAGAPAERWVDSGIKAEFSFIVSAPSGAAISIRSLEGSWVAIANIKAGRMAPAWEQWILLVGWPLSVLLYVVHLTVNRLWKKRFEWTLAKAVMARRHVENFLSHPWRSALAVFIITTLVFAMAREILVPYNAGDQRKRWSLTGDEPEYLLAAFSLAHDGDMNLRNNVRENSAGSFYRDGFPGLYHGSLEYFMRFASAMKKVDPRTWDDRQLLVHRPGVAVMVAPAMFSLERARWWAYVIMSAVCSAGVSALVYMAISYGAKPLFAVLLTLAFALSPPGFFYTNQVYPEIPFALGSALGFMCLARFSAGATPLVALIAIVLPWFSDRAIPGALMLGLAALCMGGPMKRRGIVLSILTAGALALAHYYYSRFGVIYPLHHSPRHSLSLSYMPEGFARLLLDVSRGLLWQAPALALAPVAFMAWRGSGVARPVFVFASLAIMGDIALVSAFPDWTGGVCPAGRYNVSLIWLSYPAFVIWSKVGMTTRAKVVTLLAIALGAAQTPLLLNHPDWWFARSNPVFNHPALALFYKWTPDLSMMATGEIAKAVAWAIAFMSLAMLARAKPLR